MIRLNVSRMMKITTLFCEQEMNDCCSTRGASSSQFVKRLSSFRLDVALREDFRLKSITEAFSNETIYDDFEFDGTGIGCIDHKICKE